MRVVMKTGRLGYGGISTKIHPTKLFGGQKIKKWGKSLNSLFFNLVNGQKRENSENGNFGNFGKCSVLGYFCIV